MYCADVCVAVSPTVWLPGIAQRKLERTRKQKQIVWETHNFIMLKEGMLKEDTQTVISRKPIPR